MTQKHAAAKVHRFRAISVKKKRSSSDDLAKQLSECESKIQKYRIAFDEAGRALIQIREEKLWQGAYRSFQQYLRQKWHFGRRNAINLMNSVSVMDNLTASTARPLPATESQVRPMAGLSAGRQKAIWAEVVKRHKIDKTPLTAKLVQNVKAEHCRQSGRFLPISDARGCWQWDVSDANNVSLPSKMKLNKKEEAMAGGRNVVVSPCLSSSDGANIDAKFVEEIRKHPQWTFVLSTSNVAVLEGVGTWHNTWLGLIADDALFQDAKAFAVLDRLDAKLKFLEIRQLTKRVQLPTLKTLGWVVIGPPGLKTRPDMASFAPEALRHAVGQCWQNGWRVFVNPHLRSMLNQVPAIEVSTPDLPASEGAHQLDEPTEARMPATQAVPLVEHKRQERYPSPGEVIISDFGNVEYRRFFGDVDSGISFQTIDSSSPGNGMASQATSDQSLLASLVSNDLKSMASQGPDQTDDLEELCIAEDKA